jgi:hypothetical protein
MSDGASKQAKSRSESTRAGAGSPDPSVSSAGSGRGRKKSKRGKGKNKKKKKQKDSDDDSDEDDSDDDSDESGGAQRSKKKKRKSKRRKSDDDSDDSDEDSDVDSDESGGKKRKGRRRRRHKNQEILVKKKKKPREWTEDQAAEAIQGLYRIRKSRKILRAVVCSVWRKVYDKWSGTYFYKDIRTGESSWVKPELMGTEDLPSPRTIIKMGKRRGGPGGTDGKSKNMPWDEQQEVVYGEEVPLRHDEIFSAKLEDGVQPFEPPEESKHLDVFWCRVCRLFGQYEVTDKVCLHCGVHAKVKSLKEMALKNPKDPKIKQLLLLQEQQIIEKEREDWRFTEDRIQRLRETQPWEDWEDDGQEAEPVSSEEEKEVAPEEEKDSGTPGRVECTIILKQDVDDLPPGSMEYTSFMKGFATHLAVATGLEKDQFKIQDLQEHEKFIPRFDPKTGLTVEPKEEASDDPVMSVLVIFVPDVENRDNLEITRAAEIMKDVLEHTEDNEDHSLLKGQFGEMIYLDEIAKFTFYEFSEHGSDDEGGAGGGDKDGDTDGKAKDKGDGAVEGAVEDVQGGEVDPETGKRHRKLADGEEAEEGKEAEEEEEEDEMPEPFQFMYQMDDQDDGRAKVILPFRKDLSEMMPGSENELRFVESFMDDIFQATGLMPTRVQLDQIVHEPLPPPPPLEWWEVQAKEEAVAAAEAEAEFAAKNPYAVSTLDLPGAEEPEPPPPDPLGNVIIHFTILPPVDEDNDMSVAQLLEILTAQFDDFESPLYMGKVTALIDFEKELSIKVMDPPMPDLGGRGPTTMEDAAKIFQPELDVDPDAPLHFEIISGVNLLPMPAKKVRPKPPPMASDQLLAWQRERDREDREQEALEEQEPPICNVFCVAYFATKHKSICVGRTPVVTTCKHPVFAEEECGEKEGTSFRLPVDYIDGELKVQEEFLVEQVDEEDKANTIAAKEDEEEGGDGVLVVKEKQDQGFLARVHKIFSEMDIDHNGAVTKEEQEEYYKRSGANMDDEKVRACMDEQWTKVDVNKDGSVSFAEFEKVALAMDGQSSEGVETKPKKKKAIPKVFLSVDVFCQRPGNPVAEVLGTASVKEDLHSLKSLTLDAKVYDVHGDNVHGSKAHASLLRPKLTLKFSRKTRRETTTKSLQNDTHALIIVNAYFDKLEVQHPEPRKVPRIRKECLKDGWELRRVLTHPYMCNVPRSNVTLVRNATVAQFNQALKELGERCTSTSNVMIYMCTHVGYIRKGKREHKGDYFLMRDSSFITPEVIYESCIHMKTLGPKLAALPGRQKIAFLDVVHTEHPGAQTFKTRVLHAHHDIYTRFTAQTGFVVIGAVDLGLTITEVQQKIKAIHDSGDRSIIDTKLKRHDLINKLVAGELPFYDNGHSLFCKYLIRGLRGAAGSLSKPFIDLYDLFQYMQKGVSSEMLEKNPEFLEVTFANNAIKLREDGNDEDTTTREFDFDLSRGRFTGPDLAKEIEERMSSTDSGNHYSVTFCQEEHKFTITRLTPNQGIIEPPPQPPKTEEELRKQWKIGLINMEEFAVLGLESRIYYQEKKMMPLLEEGDIDQQKYDEQMELQKDDFEEEVKAMRQDNADLGAEEETKEERVARQKAEKFKENIANGRPGDWDEEEEPEFPKPQFTLMFQEMPSSIFRLLGFQFMNVKADIECPIETFPDIEELEHASEEGGVPKCQMVSKWTVKFQKGAKQTLSKSTPYHLKIKGINPFYHKPSLWERMRLRRKRVAGRGTPFMGPWIPSLPSKAPWQLEQLIHICPMPKPPPRPSIPREMMERRDGKSVTLTWSDLPFKGHPTIKYEVQVRGYDKGNRDWTSQESFKYRDLVENVFKLHKLPDTGTKDGVGIGHFISLPKGIFLQARVRAYNAGGWSSCGPVIDFLWPTYQPPLVDLDRMLEAMRGGVRSILMMMAKNRHIVNIQQIGCKLLLNIGAAGGYTRHSAAQEVVKEVLICLTKYDMDNQLAINGFSVMSWALYYHYKSVYELLSDSNLEKLTDGALEHFGKQYEDVVSAVRQLWKRMEKDVRGDRALLGQNEAVRRMQRMCMGKIARKMVTDLVVRQFSRVMDPQYGQWTYVNDVTGEVSRSPLPPPLAPLSLCAQQHANWIASAIRSPSRFHFLSSGQVEASILVRQGLGFRAVREAAKEGCHQRRESQGEIGENGG